MNQRSPNNRRDLNLFAIIISIGVALMIGAGQLAARLPSTWSLSANMRSNLTPNFFSRRPEKTLPVVGAGAGEQDDTYLTPGTGTASGVSSGPIDSNDSATFTQRPSATATSTQRSAPTATRTSPPTATSTKFSTVVVVTSTRTATRTPIRTSTSVSRTPTMTATRTATSLFTATRTATPTRTATSTSTATATATSTPTSSATATFTVMPTATNTATSTPTATATNTPSPTATSTATSTPIVSTPQGTSTAVPIDLEIGTPDGDAGFLPDESYVIINLSTPIVVNEFQDGNYDLVIYEFLTNPPDNDRIQLDNIIISISTDGTNYYQIFNWWDNAPNDNTSIRQHPIPPGEVDNYLIFKTDLYGTPHQSGILIDLEDALSNPPAGDYYFIAIEVPTTGSDGSGVDAIEIIDIPMPFP